MRRMATTKELDLLYYLSKSITPNTLPEEIKVLCPYVNLEEITRQLEDLNANEGIDWENHTVSGMVISYYSTPDFEEVEVNLCNDESIEFPETISTIAELANWFAENGLPQNDDTYIDDIVSPPEGYDFGDREFEYNGKKVILIGYRDNSYNILKLESIYELDDIVFINCNNLQANYVKTNILTPVTGSYVQVNGSLKTQANNQYIQAGAFYGQLGSSGSSANKAAFVTALYPGSLSHIQEENGTLYVHSNDSVSLEGYDGDSNVYISADTGNIELSSAGDIVMSPNQRKCIIMNIPTSDPHVANALWNDNGVLKISSGS